MRDRIRKWLGIERLDQRLVTVERHFVTRHDPKTGVPVETLADRAADEDGRERPTPLPRSNQWNLRRRQLEAQHAQAPKRHN